MLIEALGLLRPAERERLRIQVVGEPHLDTAPLEARAKALGLGACLAFELGFLPQDRMAALVADADAMLFPYREIEASGVLMQAMAAGVPVVASRIGAFAELLEDGRQGLLVPPGDPLALAAALRRLALNPACLTAMRSGMRDRRDRIPGWTAIGHQTMAVYAAAARHHGALPVGRPAAIKETSP